MWQEMNVNHICLEANTTDLARTAHFPVQGILGSMIRAIQTRGGTPRDTNHHDVLELVMEEDVVRFDHSHLRSNPR